MNPNERLRNVLNQGQFWDERFLAQAEKNLVAAYREALTAIRSKVEWMYRYYGEDVDYSQMNQYNRLLNLEKEIAGEIRGLTGEDVRVIRNTIKGTFKENYNLVGYAAESTTGARLGFGGLNTEAVNAAVLNPMDRISWITRESANGKLALKQISEGIAQSLMHGEGYFKTAAKMKDVLQISAGRTVRIIRTEAHRAQSMGRLEGFDKAGKSAEDLGMEVRKMWVSAHDERTRASHRHMDGKLASEDGLFHLPATKEHGAITCEAPGLTGYPGEDINCRCTPVISFKDLPYRDTEGQDFENYAEWAERKGVSSIRILKAA
jgi:hypothetical protein